VSENPRPWYRLPLCWAAMCGCTTQSDDTGCWGECATCHRRFGFVDRATLRRACDREVALALSPDRLNAGEG